MAKKVYGSSALPGDVVTVLSGGTVDISIGFNAVVGIVGGMDTANGTASAGTIKEVSSVSKAAEYFGTDSELHRAVKVAYANGVKNVHAVGVTETSVTESFSSVASGTLTNTPAFDPNVNTEHDITAQDTTAGVSVTVNIVYDEGANLTAPSDANTMNLNPITGEWKADASSSYDITYDYGDYSTSITDMSKEDVRFVNVLSENESVASTLATELDNRDDVFDFKRGVVGGKPGMAESDYSDNIDDQRIVIVQPPRSKDFDGIEVRTSAAVAGALTSAPLGESTTGSRRGRLDGVDSVGVHYASGPTLTELENFTSNHQLLTVRDAGVIYVTKDVTTSTDSRFDRVYATEIVDEAVELSHQINDSFIGALNFEENRETLRDQHTAAYKEMREDRPPLLDAYSVTVSKDSSNADEVDVEIGLDVVNVMDTIDVTVTVGDVTKSATVA